ncbi:MAG: hypothetical protein ACREHG_08515, partial [Candidatus Saccharimonadales bacterium]
MAVADLWRVPNFPDVQVKQQTDLDADAAAGQNQTTVLNINGFAANDYVYLSGDFGAENAE